MPSGMAQTQVSNTIMMLPIMAWAMPPPSVPIGAGISVKNAHDRDLMPLMSTYTSRNRSEPAPMKAATPARARMTTSVIRRRGSTVRFVWGAMATISSTRTADGAEPPDHQASAHDHDDGDAE